MNSHNNNKQMLSPPHPDGNRIWENCTVLCLSHQVKKAVRDKSLDVCPLLSLKSSLNNHLMLINNNWIKIMTSAYCFFMNNLFDLFFAFSYLHLTWSINNFLSRKKTEWLLLASISCQISIRLKRKKRNNICFY
jgi:hypothetical protein